MSNLICPFCQQELEDANIHSSGLYFECPNCYMKQKEKDDNYTATPRIWQELIRTRKALDVAINAMKSAGAHNSINCIARGEDPSKDDVGITINHALEQITAEQKDK